MSTKNYEVTITRVIVVHVEEAESEEKAIEYAENEALSEHGEMMEINAIELNTPTEIESSRRHADCIARAD